MASLYRALVGLVPLRHRADWRSLFFLMLLAALFATQWTGWLRHWALVPPTCLLAFFACVIKHNHVHCRTFSHRGWNRGFGHVLGLLTGHPTTAIITAHNVRHHQHNNTALDWVRCSLVKFRWNWLNLILFPFVSVVRMRRDKSSDLRQWRRTRPALFRQAIAERAVLYAFILVLVTLDWKATLVYLGVPWLFAQWALVTINLLQHQDCDPSSEFDHSRNITGSFINWFFLNNGFHTVHHIRPSLHWSFLPEFHRASIESRMRSHLNHRSLLAACWRQFFDPRRAAAASDSR